MYPKTLKEARGLILQFTRDLTGAELEKVAAELQDRLPPPLGSARELLNAALALLRCDFGGPFPEAARELVAQALEYAFLTGGDLGRAAYAYIEGYRRDIEHPQGGEAALTPEGLQATLHDILNGEEDK